MQISTRRCHLAGLFVTAVVILTVCGPDGEATAGSEGRSETSAPRRVKKRAPVRIAYPEELPIAAHSEAIARAISDYQVVLVCAETGSGKSTSLYAFLSTISAASASFPLMSLLRKSTSIRLLSVPR